MKNKDNINYIGIVGVGRFGKSISEKLVEHGIRVIVMDKSEEALSSIQDKVETVIIGDATDEQTLIDSGLQYTDIVIVCYAQDLAKSILTTMLLKEIGVKRIITKAANLLHLRILKKIGADQVVLPEADSGIRLANKIASPGFQELVELTPGYSIAEVKIPNTFIGKSLIEIDLRRNYNIAVLLIRSEEEKVNISPGRDTKFNKNDVLTVLGKDIDLKKFSNL